MPETHTVEVGESILSIADKYKFTRWQSIYYHESNADLRKKRPDPMYFMEGDEVQIPDFDERREICETGKTHVFQLEKPCTTHLQLVMMESENMPYALKKYTLSMKGLETITGTTTKDGEVIEEVPVQAKKAELSLWPGDNTEPLKYNIKIGDIDPIEEDTGVQDRLLNLGYDLGGEYGEIGPNTKEVIKIFQERQGLSPADGEPNAETRKALEWL